MSESQTEPDKETLLVFKKDHLKAVVLIVILEKEKQIYL
jgi:hypothetical protein